MAFKFRVLSIDGGGIRGIVPAIILAEIEKRTEKRISELFDLIAGTSTGGVLALGLTKPHPHQVGAYYTAEKLIDLYRQCRKRIFYEPFVEHVLGDLDDLTRPKYASKGREAVLTEYLGDTQLEKATTEVFITSYDTELRTPIFFTSNAAAEKTGQNFRKICSGFTMKQAAMATSAAPTYFEPYQIKTAHETDTGYYSLIDGGVFANNPTTLAVMEAIISAKKSSEPKEQLTLDDILVVSIGTGSLSRRFPYDQTKNWGRIQWVRPLLNITLDGQSEAVACQLEQLLPHAQDKPKQYYRFQAPLNTGNDNVDDISEQNIAKLEELAKLIINERDRDLDELCQQLQLSSVKPICYQS